MTTYYKTNNLDWELVTQQWDNEIQHRASRRRSGHDYSQQGVLRRKAEGLRKLDELKTTFKQGETDTSGSPHPTQLWPLPQLCKCPPRNQPKRTLEQRKADTKESPYSTQLWRSLQPCKSNQPPSTTETVLGINAFLLGEEESYKLSVFECEEIYEGLQESDQRKAKDLRKFNKLKTTFKQGETDAKGSPHPTQPWPLPQLYKHPPQKQPKRTVEQRKADAKESPYYTQSWLTQTMLDNTINGLLERMENKKHELLMFMDKEEEERLPQSVEREEQERLLRETEQVEKETGPQLKGLESSLGTASSKEAWISSTEQVEKETGPQLKGLESNLGTASSKTWISSIMNMVGWALPAWPRSMEQEAKLARLQKLSELLAAVVNRIKELIALKKRKPTEDFSSGQKKFYVVGSVYGTVVEALPDTGADTCFISPDLASRFGLRPIPGTRKRVTLANKKAVKSPGMVKVPWKFTKERNTHTINCWILPGCTRHLVLGNPFLQATQTLTKFRDRIKSKLLTAARIFSLSVLGDEKQRLRGYLNGQLAAALPDTGSDAMLINGAYARKIGLSIDSNVENQVKVRLADGSTTMTSGIVRDVDWRVGSTTVRCSFYVLENMCVDVILSNDYLFEMDIFSKEKQHFFHVNSENYSKHHSLYFCVLRLIKKKRVTILTPKEQEELEKQKEWYRRDIKRDEIMALPEGQRETAARAEKARQQRWEELRPEREARWIAESRTVTGSVQNSVSWGGRWKK